MKKSIVMSIKPYWAFLIIAKAKGWNVPHYKIIEARKNQPTDLEWDRTVQLYVTGDKASFALIPEEYRSEMKQYLYRVIAEFKCTTIDRVDVPYPAWQKDLNPQFLQDSCLTYADLHNYVGSGGVVKGWHIDDLVLFDTPKKLTEFKVPCDEQCYACGYHTAGECFHDLRLTRPAQSWCYVVSET